MRSQVPFALQSSSGSFIRDFLDDGSKPRENHHRLKARIPFVKTVGSPATAVWGPISAAVMLRIYFMQQWHNLSDPASERGLPIVAAQASTKKGTTWHFDLRSILKPPSGCFAGLSRGLASSLFHIARRPRP